MRLVSPAASVPASMTRYLLPHEHSCVAVRKHPAELAGPLILVFGGLVAAGELTRRSVRPKIVWGAYLSVLLYFLQQVAASLAGDVLRRDGYAVDPGQRVHGPQGGDDAAGQGDRHELPALGAGPLAWLR